ncbi:MAG: hypothetical protein DI585_01505 [Pseudomonas fluorescens]|nr:MAG: hypothetical protein DI585_01505 [Pseudomonas fluorescens]
MTTHRILRTTALASALIALAAPAMAEEEIYQDVVVIQTTTVTTASADQGFDTIEPAAGPTTYGQHNTFPSTQQREYEMHRYDDANYKG